MPKLHPKMLKKDGRNAFVVLPCEEFQALQERLRDAEDLLALRRAAAGQPPAERPDAERPERPVGPHASATAPPPGTAHIARRRGSTEPFAHPFP